MRRLGLSRTVVALGVVSFFTDLSTEMIYPLLPVFLASTLALGKAAPAALGVIEGVAETTASVLKVVSGVWSDRTRARKPLIVLGYTISSVSRPLIGLAFAWPMVLAVRVCDRIGKGLRTSPRDALIADITPPDRRGRAYGLHRGMDHAGALVGPLVAAALLQIEGLSLRTLFLLAAIPGACALAALVWGVREGRRASPPAPSSAPGGHRLSSFSSLPLPFRRMLLAILVFTLGNSADSFLLLRLESAGIAPAMLAVLWSGLHAVKMLSTLLGGALSDVVGRKPLVIAGWILFALCYLALGRLESAGALCAVFLLYGVHFGLTEPTERGWVADLAPSDHRAGAFGWYHLAIGLAALPASLVFGLVWKAAGPGVAFPMGAACAGVATLLLVRVPEPRPAGPEPVELPEEAEKE